jgi:hypothetical protein
VVAAVFAIFGIVALFAGLPIFAAIMGIVIELGKVVGVVWVYRNWDEKTKLKFVMIPFVLMMMVLTSGGIFGLLSKAHLEQTAPVTNNTAKIERLDQRITRERTEIADAELIIDQLDDTVRVLVDARKISHPTEGSKIVRINQQPQRDQLKGIINESMDSIDGYEDEKLVLNQELNELELELGPVKYIAAIIYEEPADQIDEAVRMVIMAFIFVFDPMAILLLMAGNYTLMGRVSAAPIAPKQKIVPNADMKFVPADVMAEVVAEIIDEKIPPKTTTNEPVEITNTDGKAKSVEIPAEPTDDDIGPHGQGIYAPQHYRKF